MDELKVNFYNSGNKSFFMGDGRTDDKGFIGYLRGDFGRNGTEFWSTWFPNNEELNTNEFKQEIDTVVNFLREGILKDRQSMNKAAGEHRDCLLECDGTSYGVFVDTKHYEFDLRMNVNMGTYDYYIFCEDKRLASQDILNKKRFRDENGILTESIEKIAELTLDEGLGYYIDGDRYRYRDEEYTFKKSVDGMWFENDDGRKITVSPDNIGTFLPGIAEAKNSFTKIPLKETLTNLKLGDLLEGVTLNSVHLIHQDEDIELATIEEFDLNMLTDEGRRAWSDVLSAKVNSIFEGSYGVQIECSEVDADRLSQFSYMLSGNWSEEEYDRWMKPPNEPGQSMEL